MTATWSWILGVLWIERILQRTVALFVVNFIGDKNDWHCIYIQRVIYLYRPYGCFFVRFHQRQENNEGCQNLLSGEVCQIKPGLKLLIFIDGSIRNQNWQAKEKKMYCFTWDHNIGRRWPPSLLQQRDWFCPPSEDLCWPWLWCWSTLSSSFYISSTSHILFLVSALRPFVVGCWF